MNPSLAIWCCSSKQHAHTNKKTGEVRQNVFFSLALAPTNKAVYGTWVTEATYFERVDELKPFLIISGWSLMGGLVRPPSMPGRFIHNFFPHVMTVDHHIMADIYAIADILAAHYNVPLAPQEEAMRPCLVGEWHHRNLPGLTATLSQGEPNA